MDDNDQQGGFATRGRFAAVSLPRPSLRGALFTVIGRPVALVALVVTVASLTSCAATGSNSFLGSEYDGPTAAYGYNLP
jgi:hypothetical protein